MALSMAMRLELSQYQSSNNAASAGRPGPATLHRGAQTACHLPSLRNIYLPTTKSMNRPLLSSQSGDFINAISLSMLRPREGPDRESTKPLGVARASARKDGHSWEHDHWSDFKPPAPKEDAVNFMSFIADLVKKIVKLAGVMLLLSTIFAATAPAILSWSRGRKIIMSVASYSIPGTVSIARASLGWRKPVLLEGISLTGTDGEAVVSIPKIETRASLWSIVRGKTGLGDATLMAPVVDLREDPVSGQPRLALALTPVWKVKANNPNPDENKKRVAAEKASKVVALAATFKAPGGGLEVVKGKAILSPEAAAVVGPTVFLDVSAGRFATEGNEGLEAEAHEHEGKVPILANLHSDRAQVEGLGFLSFARCQIQLLRPLKFEMDLTPELGKHYLSRVNPLFGEFIGPTVGEDDRPDVTLYVAPEEFVLPSDGYDIRIEPIRTTLAKGHLVDVLNLLSRQDLLTGRSQITALTGPIEVFLSKFGDLSLTRADLLLADRVHVAIVGYRTRHNVFMDLAIPGSTLHETLGLSRLAHDYYLKIPIGGSSELPEVDLLEAGKGIALLKLLQQQTDGAGQLLSSFFQQDYTQFSTVGHGVPSPVGVLPWDTRS